jgi:F-type H+-transporting ATPase subunit b
MAKRLLILLAFGIACAMPAARLIAAEEGGAPHGADHSGPEYHLIPESHEEATQAIYAAVWVLIIFIILLAILYPTAWRNVLNGLNNREQRIRTDIAEAEAARARSEDLLKQFDQQIAAAQTRSSEMISAATVQGEKLATQIRMQAQQESESTKEAATQEIEAARDAAIQQIRGEVAGLATMVASKVMRRNLGVAENQDLVDEAIASMQSA